MEHQIEGVEWVLVSLFALGVVAVIVAAIREFKKFRAGDPGGDGKPKDEP
jgi:hypothetical protein